MELRKKPEHYNIDPAWAAIDPVPVLSTPAYGEMSAPVLVKKLKINSPKDAKQLAEAKAKSSEAPDPDRRLTEIAKEISTRLDNRPDFKTVLKKLRSNETFVYLARAVDPAIAGAIMDKFPEVGAERQDLRHLHLGGEGAVAVVGDLHVEEPWDP